MAVAVKGTAPGTTHGPMLIDIQHHRLFSGLAANISDLENSCAAQALLDLQIVIKGVGSAEVMADAEYIERSICAVQASLARRYSLEYLLAGLPSEAVVKSIERDGRWT